MHGISMGWMRQPHWFDQLDSTQSTTRWHRHGQALSGDQSSNPSSVSNTLANLSTSVASLRDQLDTLATNMGLPDSGTLGAYGMGAQLISKAKGEIEIHTQEGDTVTLKFSNKVALSYDTAQVSDGETTATATSLQAATKSRIGVSVQGDLNDDELAAITDLVAKVGELTGDFYNNDLESAVNKAMSLSYDTSQIADFSLDLRLKQSVKAYTYAIPLPSSVAANADTAATDATTVVAPPVDATDAATAVTAIDASTAEQTESDASATAETSSATTDASSTTNTADQTGSNATTDVAQPSADNATQVFADFVAKVRAAFNISAGDASLGISYEMKVHVLLSSIAASAPSDSSPSDTTLGYLGQQLSTNG